jgi:hypothetical protein
MHTGLVERPVNHRRCPPSSSSFSRVLQSPTAGPFLSLSSTSRPPLLVRAIAPYVRLVLRSTTSRLLFFRVPLSRFFFICSLLTWLVSAVGLQSFDLSTLFCTQVFGLSISCTPCASLSPTLPGLRSLYLGLVTHSLSNSKVWPPPHLHECGTLWYVFQSSKES